MTKELIERIEKALCMAQNATEHAVGSPDQPTPGTRLEAELEANKAVNDVLHELQKLRQEALIPPENGGTAEDHTNPAEAPQFADGGDGFFRLATELHPDQADGEVVKLRAFRDRDGVLRAGIYANELDNVTADWDRGAPATSKLDADLVNVLIPDQSNEQAGALLAIAYGRIARQRAAGADPLKLLVPRTLKPWTIVSKAPDMAPAETTEVMAPTRRAAEAAAAVERTADMLQGMTTAIPTTGQR